MSDEEVDELLKAVDTSSGEINYMGMFSSSYSRTRLTLSKTWSERSLPTRRRPLRSTTNTIEQDSGYCVFDYRGMDDFGSSKEGIPAFWHQYGYKLPLDMRTDCNALRLENTTISKTSRSQDQCLTRERKDVLKHQYTDSGRVENEIICTYKHLETHRPKSSEGQYQDKVKLNASELPEHVYGS